MRVISQRGNVDLPYEQIVVRSEMEYVMAVHKEKEYVLGKYSSDDKAIKAMEMLREAYNNNEFYHCTATTNTFQESIGFLSSEKFKEVTSEYFQFPQDEDVEINNGLE